MAAVRHLGFWNSIFLLSGRLRDPFCIIVPNLREDRSLHCCDIAIFVIFQDGCRRNLGSWKIRNFDDLSRVRGHSASRLPNFIKIGQTVAAIWRFNGFFIMAAPAILDLSGVYWDHPRRLLGGLYRSAKFGLNRCSTFDNMNVLIFCAFGLKTPIHAPKIGVLGDLTPLLGSNINVTTKRH